MAITTPATGFSRAWYGASIDDFRKSDPDAVFGILAKNPEFDLAATQKEAWLEQIAFLQKNLEGLPGTLFLEFNIPRMGSRVDVVLLIGPVVFVVEFKVGEAAFNRADIEQVWDYALDLKNFHEASHQVSLVPILIATEARESVPAKLAKDADWVYRPIPVHPGAFRATIESVMAVVSGAALDQSQWAQGAYKPTPTIVEAARALYAHHGVEAIKAFDAATEFQVQGLEVDWAVVTWDGDFRFRGSSWGFHDFRGAKWQNVKSPENQSYLKNAYRVLLTRARQGMVIFVPEGDPKDHTRPPAYYDSTFQYLRDVGIPEA